MRSKPLPLLAYARAGTTVGATSWSSLLLLAKGYCLCETPAHITNVIAASATALAGSSRPSVTALPATLAYPIVPSSHEAPWLALFDRCPQAPPTI